MAGAVLAIGKAACVVVNTLQAGKAVYDIYETLQDEKLGNWAKALRVSTGGLCVIANAADAGLTIADKSVSPDVRVGVASAAAGASILHEFSELAIKPSLSLSDWMNFSAFAVFQVAAVVDKTCRLQPQFFGEYREGISLAAQLSECSSMVVMKRDVIANGASTAWKTILSLIPTPDAPSPPRMVIHVEGEHQDPFLEVDPEYAELIEQVRTTHNIEEFGEIPEIFRFDGKLNRYKCPLTNSPIRIVVSVRSSEAALPVYYERESIYQWIESYPQQIPPHWPTELPFHPSLLQPDPVAQDKINRRLQVLLNNLQQVRVVAQESFITRRVRELRGDDPEELCTKMSEEICHSRALSGYISTVQTSRIWKDFTNSTHSMLTNLFQIRFCRSQSPDPVERNPTRLISLIQPERLARIIWGDSDDEKKRILMKVVKLIDGINIFISIEDPRVHDYAIVVSSG